MAVILLLLIFFHVFSNSHLKTRAIKLQHLKRKYFTIFTHSSRYMCKMGYPDKYFSYLSVKCKWWVPIRRLLMSTHILCFHQVTEALLMRINPQHNVFDPINVHIPISAQSRDSLVFRLQAVYQLLYKIICCEYPFELH